MQRSETITDNTLKNKGEQRGGILTLLNYWIQFIISQHECTIKKKNLNANDL